jgi:hypothetical protein
MPSDVIVNETRGAMRIALDFLKQKIQPSDRRHSLFRQLQETERLLAADLAERQEAYPAELDRRERADIDAVWARYNEVDRHKNLTQKRDAQRQRFEQLRQLNGGSFPLNLSPVLYVIPLILLGVGEWYVNYATFAAKLVPAFAIAATLLVAAVFAATSHVHGAFIKQISELMNPSVEYHHVRDRKIIFVIMTIVLLLALGAIVWLRYIAISEQLGLSEVTASNVFGGASATKVWSLLLPTVVLNIAIWGVGTFYSWWFHERIPELRECYRQMLATEHRIERSKRPYERDVKRVSATYDRERKNNDVVRREEDGLLDEVRAAIGRLSE